MIENGHSEASIRERLDVLAGQALLAASSGNQKKQNEITLEKNLLEAKLVQVDNLKNIKKQIEKENPLYELADNGEYIEIKKEKR